MLHNPDFVHKILENPADDATRLIYADWLEERGETELAGRVRTKLPPVSELRGRTKATHGWYRYANRLLEGVIPKSWSGWPIPMPSQESGRASATEIERGENPLSWPYSCGIASFNSSKPSVVVSLRHGFISAIAMPWRRLWKILPRLFSEQPIESVAVTGLFLEFEHFLHPVGFEGSHQTRCIRQAANQIPPEVWELLTPPPWPADNDNARTYPSLTAAFEDLSQAVVALGNRMRRTPA